MPRKSVPRIRAIHVSVIRALRPSGLLKAGTPLEMASMPVIAEQPAAKDLRTRKIVSASLAFASGKLPMIGACSRKMELRLPTIIGRGALPVKRVVGIAEIERAARQP